MSFGKIYNYPRAPRSTMCLYIAAYNNLDIEVVETWPIKVDASKGGVGPAFLSKFPTGKVPALERPDGYTIYECVAIAYYLAKQNPSTKLLGSALEEEGSILQWSSFANSELLPPIMAWINPVIGKAPRTEKTLAKAEDGTEPMLAAVTEALKRGGGKFLVGDGLTMADLFVVAALARGYEFVFTKSWAAQHPEIHEYYMRIRSDAVYEKVDGKAVVLDQITFK